MAKQRTINDKDRQQWVHNDEPLYFDWKRTGKGITTYVRENREIIDQVINECLDRKPTS